MFNITFSSINYLFNSFFSTILIFLFFFNGLHDKAAQIGVLSSFLVVLFNIFSSNKRNLILAERKKSLISETFIFRFIFLFPSLILYSGYLIIFEKVNYFNILIFFIFFSLWVNEISIVKAEIEKDKKKFLKNIIYILLFLAFIQLSLLEKGYSFQISSIIFVSLITFIQVMNIFELKNTFRFKFKSFIQSIKNNIFSFSFLSSFSFLLSVFIWRVFLVKYLGETQAAIYFMVFAIASFPGTFLNNFLGLSILNYNYELFRKYLFFLILGILIAISLTISDFFQGMDYQIYELLSYNILTDLIIFSFFGTIIMALAVYYRLKTFINLKKKNKLFIFDFYYGLIMSSIVPILCIHFFDYIHFSYLVGSIFSLLYFLTINLILLKN